jgi:hypothetical protein
MVPHRRRRMPRVLATAAAAVHRCFCGRSIRRISAVEELEKRISETEALNDAVLKQIDSVLDNLGKKVRETEKARMRAVMAALTGENMRCDLDLRVLSPRAQEQDRRHQEQGGQGRA